MRNNLWEKASYFNLCHWVYRYDTLSITQCTNALVRRDSSFWENASLWPLDFVFCSTHSAVICRRGVEWASRPFRWIQRQEDRWQKSLVLNVNSQVSCQRCQNESHETTNFWDKIWRQEKESQVVTMSLCLLFCCQHKRGERQPRLMNTLCSSSWGKSRSEHSVVISSLINRVQVTCDIRHSFKRDKLYKERLLRCYLLLTFTSLSTLSPNQPSMWLFIGVLSFT